VEIPKLLYWFRRVLRNSVLGIVSASFVAGNFMLVAAHAEQRPRRRARRAPVARPVVAATKPSAKGEETRVSPYGPRQQKAP